MGHQEHGRRAEGHPRYRVPVTGEVPPPVEGILVLPRGNVGSGVLTVSVCIIPRSTLVRTPAVACRLRAQERTSLASHA